jgi:peptidoglycan/LPS O-acetylase OafA/YrhL
MDTPLPELTKIHTPSDATHYPALDLIRAFACIWVAISHLTLITGRHVFLLTQGHLAVDLFILTSGFLMCLVLHDGRDSAAKVAMPFYVRRFFRIAPAFYTAVILYAFFNLGFFNLLDAAQTHFAAPTRDDYTSTGVPAHTIALHLGFLHGLVPDETSRIFAPAWTLSLEAQFYLVAPFVMPLLRARPLMILVAAFAINLLGNHLFGTIFVHGTWIHFGKPSILPNRIFLFLLGSWTCMALSDPKRSHGLLLCAACAASFFLFGAKSGIVTACGVALVCATASRRLPARAFFDGMMRSAPVRFVANISYGIYLFHMFLIAFSFAAIRAIFPATPASPAAVAAYFAMVLIGMCIVSALVFHFIEEPMRLLGRRIAAGMKPRAGTTPPPGAGP